MGTTAQEGSAHRWPVKCIFFPDCWAGFNCLLQDLTLLLLNPTSSLIFQRNILQFASIIKLIIHPSALYCIPLSFELVCIAITLLTVGRPVQTRPTLTPMELVILVRNINLLVPSQFSESGIFFVFSVGFVVCEMRVTEAPSQGARGRIAMQEAGPAV